MVSETIPSVHRAAPRCIYAFHLYGVLRVMTIFIPITCGTKMETEISTEKNGPKDLRKKSD
jgi:hypothetical protein